MAKAYFLRGDSYLRYDVDTDTTDPGYPREITGAWSGLEGTGFESEIDAAVDLGTGKVYLFKNDVYLRVDQANNTVDGQVTSIADGWPGFTDAGFADGVTAAVNYGDGNVYFFRGDSYLRYDIAADRADGSALSIAENWPGPADAGFADSIDAAVNLGHGKVFLFKGGQYVRYDIAANRTDAGYPLQIAGNWPGIGEAGFGDSVDAVWMKLTGTMQMPSAGSLGAGDHVWYFDGQISTDLDIPRSTWFPGSTGPNDYLGHGEEIFHFVIHSDGRILRGRPHLRNHEGSFAWLNNNPGNLIGVEGGPDIGQYPGKLNAHHFLIFPAFETGFDAIARYLRGPTFRDLTILQAFELHTPASDGNDPVAYAEAVVVAAGIPMSTLLQDLDDEQMLHMQAKIVDVEGSVAGDVLTVDSADLPTAIRERMS